MEKEIWKPVKGYEGLYEVSNLGEIRKVKKEGYRLLKQSSHSAGYKLVSLRKNGEGKLLYAHRIVAKTFIPNPENKDEVNHLNGVKNDNRAVNLEWATHQENLIHCHKNGLGNCKSGEEHHASILTNEEAREIRYLYKTKKLNKKQLAEKHDCTVQTISRVLKRIIYDKIPDREMKLNKIYAEDCMRTMIRMEDNFIDLTVTSPPYDNLRAYNDNIDEVWHENIWKPIIKELYRVTKEGGVVVWVVGDASINGSETGVSFKQALYAMECGFKLHDTMIYEKNNYMPLNHKRYEQAFEYMFVFLKGSINAFNPITVKTTTNQFRGPENVRGAGKDPSSKTAKRAKIKPHWTKKEKIKRNIWRYNVGAGQSSNDYLAFEHPAIIPEELVKDHIKSWSNEGDLVYDPFMGSGTTAKMAHLLKRNWIGSELSQEYVDLAYKRLEPYLTQTTLF